MWNLYKFAEKVSFRAFLLSELANLKAAGIKFNSKLWHLALRNPAAAEDWVTLYRFLDAPANEVVLVDLGANIGEFALNFAQQIGEPKASILFEPVKATAEICRARTSGLRNCRIMERGVFHEEKEQTFHLYDDPTLNSFKKYISELYDSGRPTPTTTETVRVGPIGPDDVPEGRVFLKIDVQGAEVYATQGARSILSRTDLVLCEVAFVGEFEGEPPSFVGVAAILAEYDLYPIYFQHYGLSSSIYGLERDVLFVKRRLLPRAYSGKMLER